MHTNTEKTSANVDTGVRCGACGNTTSRANQFCSGCGQSLWEKCPSCKAAVLIGQSFCSGCGCNLQSVIDERLQQAEESIARATSLAAEGKFVAAARQLENLRSSTDFRLAELARRAEEKFVSYTAAVEHWKASLPDLEVQSAALMKQHDFKGVVRLLAKVPQGTLTEQLTKLLRQCEAHQSTIKQAKHTVKAALENKDWPEAMSALVQLTHLCPHKQKYVELLNQVAGKIFAAAKELEQNRHFAEALNVLHNIPLEFHTENQIGLRDELEEIIYLRKALARYPFATPAVGKLIQQLQKRTPGDARVDKLAARYAKVRATRPRREPWLWPEWMKADQGLFPAPIASAGLPTSILGSRPECLVRNGTQFWTAFGLALHGLGFGDPNANFLLENKNKGMLGRLSRKKPTVSQRVWGVDAGDSAIKAICLSRQGEAVRIEQAVLIPIETKQGARGELRKTDSAAIFRALQKLSVDPAFASADVVANVPGADVFARYLILPSDKEKLHEAFIEQEAAANIPISIDLLSRSYCKFPAESQMMQRAVLLAIRKTEIDSRASMFKQLNLNLSALIGDPFALYLAVKHLDFCSPRDGTSTHQPSALIIDVGHVRSSILAAKPSGAWYRAIDWGLDELTQAVASEHELGYVEAEARRRNPTCSPTILKTLDAMRNACVVPRRELERSLRVAKESIGEIAIDQPLLIGGGALQPLLGSWLNGEDI